MVYVAGDALAVIPSNDSSLGDALIEKLVLSPDSQVPVSYTHLDVYKRQVLMCGHYFDWLERKSLTARMLKRASPFLPR